MRTYKKKNVQTSPELAGRQNMPDKLKGNDDSGYSTASSQLWRRSMKVKGTNWTEEEMELSIAEYFDWCAEVSSKPNKAGLSLWLGCSKSTLWDWENKPSRSGAISNLIKRASNIIEDSYVGRIEKYPTGNVFLLKTSHGHVERSKVDIATTDAGTTANEVADAIAKLGLDK